MRITACAFGVLAVLLLFGIFANTVYAAYVGGVTGAEASRAAQFSPVVDESEDAKNLVIESDGESACYGLTVNSGDTETAFSYDMVVSCKGKTSPWLPDGVNLTLLSPTVTKDASKAFKWDEDARVYCANFVWDNEIQAYVISGVDVFAADECNVARDYEIKFNLDGTQPESDVTLDGIDVTVSFKQID